MPITKTYLLLITFSFTPLFKKQIASYPDQEASFKQTKHLHPIVMASYEGVGHFSQVKFLHGILVYGANHQAVQTVFKLSLNTEVQNADWALTCRISIK